jgi:hypothetical protein
MKKSVLGAVLGGSLALSAGANAQGIDPVGWPYQPCPMDVLNIYTIPTPTGEIAGTFSFSSTWILMIPTEWCILEMYF